MAAAWFDVSGELLRDVLGLPANAEVMGAMGQELDGFVVRLLVDSPDIPNGTILAKPVFKKIHGVSVFDRWEVIESEPKPCPQCGSLRK